MDEEDDSKGDGSPEHAESMESESSNTSAASSTSVTLEEQEETASNTPAETATASSNLSPDNTSPGESASTDRTPAETATASSNLCPDNTSPGESASTDRLPKRTAVPNAPSVSTCIVSPTSSAANHVNQSTHKVRHAAGHPHNRQSSSTTHSSGGASGCVNANHGTRSNSRNLHRDSRHHRERHRPQSTGSRDRKEVPKQKETELNEEEHGNPSNAVPAENAENVPQLQQDNGNGACAVVNQNQAVSGAVQPPNQPLSYNWQASKPIIRERLIFIFNSETLADVHFLVGKGAISQRVPAHRFVLAIGSAVFDAMFNGGMATTSSEVELPDVEPAAFIALLKFLYTDEVNIGPETVMTTLYTAKKYAVPALEQACVDFLKRNLNSDNAFMLLTQARLFDEPQLAALCLETIDKNTSEAVSAEGFTDIDLETLCVVLERDTLGIRECKLFNSVCRWSEAECIRQNLTLSSTNKRQVLSRALQLIRFPLMTVEEFAMGAAQSAILNDREVVELFLHFTVNPKPSVHFPDTPRCCLTGKEQVVSRFCQIESRWGYSGTSDRIRFIVNRRIFVVGFAMYGSILGPVEYNVSIQIIHTDTGTVCGQNDTSFQCDGTNSTFRVMFKEPVEIMPNASFTACSTLKGPDSYYGTKGLRKVTHESVTSGKVTFQFTYAAGNNNGTSVEDGQLPEIIFYT